MGIKEQTEIHTVRTIRSVTVFDNTNTDIHHELYYFQITSTTIRDHREYPTLPYG